MHWPSKEWQVDIIHLGGTKVHSQRILGDVGFHALNDAISRKFIRLHHRQPQHWCKEPSELHIDLFLCVATSATAATRQPKRNCQTNSALPTYCWCMLTWLTCFLPTQLQIDDLTGLLLLRCLPLPGTCATNDCDPSYWQHLISQGQSQGQQPNHPGACRHWQTFIPCIHMLSHMLVTQSMSAAEQLLEMLVLDGSLHGILCQHTCFPFWIPLPSGSELAGQDHPMQRLPGFGTDFCWFATSRYIIVHGIIVLWNAERQGVLKRHRTKCYPLHYRISPNPGPSLQLQCPSVRSCQSIHEAHTKRTTHEQTEQTLVVLMKN